MLSTSIEGNEVAINHPWYQKTLATDSEYGYYAYKVGEAQSIIEPYVVVAPSIIAPITTGYDVYVDAFSRYGIKSIKCSTKNYPINASEWIFTREINGNTFTAHYNSTYYILVDDNNGTKVVIPFIADNIGSKGMAKPTVNGFNNTKTNVVGRGEAGSTVVVVTGTKEYTAKVLSNGTFTVKVGAQPAGDTLYVYTKDETNGRESEKVKVRVKRNGPDKLTVNKRSEERLVGKEC